MAECVICGAAMVSRVYERDEWGRAIAGIVCCPVDPWHSDEPLDPVAWSQRLAKAEPFRG